MKPQLSFNVFLVTVFSIVIMGLIMAFFVLTSTTCGHSRDEAGYTVVEVEHDGKTYLVFKNARNRSFNQPLFVLPKEE